MQKVTLRWALLGSILIFMVVLALAGEAPKVSAALPAPQLTAPADSVTLPSFGVTLAWNLPAGAQQVHVQVLPVNNDGPGVDLIRSASSEFTLPPPPMAFVLLPDMSYRWRVRATERSGAAADDATAWGPWSDLRSFRTPHPSTAAAEPMFPGYGALLDSAAPVVLRWTHPDANLFYWELQVSGDPLFVADPATATSFVWHNLVHGGASPLPNSWRTPPLIPGESYYWRVRPRVQGDGTSVAWGPTFSFVVAASPFGAAGFDVRQFGAKGDGRADDQPALDAAIAAASAAGGGTVLLPPGSFRIGRTVHLKSNVTVQGAGMGATVIRSGELPPDDPRAGYTTRTQIRGVGVRNVTVRSLTIVCETETEQAGISFDEHSVNVRVGDVEAIGQTIAPLRAVGGTQAVWFVNNYVHDTKISGTGILLDSFHPGTTIRDVFITGNRVENIVPDSAQGGISIWVANGASVSDVVIANNVVSKVQASRGSHGDAIGIYHHTGAIATERVVIANNISQGNASHGFYVQAAVGTISHVTLTGNIATNNRGAGLGIISTGGQLGGIIKHMIIQNNVFSGNDRGAIEIGSNNGSNTWMVGNNTN